MNYYCVFVHFHTHDALHIAHNDIKMQDFVLKARFLNYKNARRASIHYINKFFDKVYGVGQWKHLPADIPPTPKSYSDRHLLPEGYSCTEDPSSWKLSVWNKIIKPGLIYNCDRVEKLFDVDILQVYEYDDDEDDYRDSPKITRCKPFYFKDTDRPNCSDSSSEESD